MKTFTSLSLVLFLSCCSINTYATELRLMAGDDSVITKICMAAANDSVRKVKLNLRKLTGGSAISVRPFINSIRCNDQYIGIFAKTLNAKNTFAYLDRYTNKKNRNRKAQVTIKKVAIKDGINKGKTVALLINGN